MRTNREILKDLKSHKNEYGYIGMTDAVHIEVELLLNIRDLLLGKKRRIED